MLRLSGQSFHQERTILVLMKLLVNKVDDTDPQHFTSIITPLPVKSYYGLLTISAVNVNNTFQVFNSKQSKHTPPKCHLRHFAYILHESH